MPYNRRYVENSNAPTRHRTLRSGQRRPPSSWEFSRNAERRIIIDSQARYHALSWGVQKVLERVHKPGLSQDTPPYPFLAPSPQQDETSNRDVCRRSGSSANAGYWKTSQVVRTKAVGQAQPGRTDPCTTKRSVFPRAPTLSWLRPHIRTTAHPEGP